MQYFFIFCRLIGGPSCWLSWLCLEWWAAPSVSVVANWTPVTLKFDHCYHWNTSTIMMTLKLKVLISLVFKVSSLSHKRYSFIHFSTSQSCTGIITCPTRLLSTDIFAQHYTSAISFPCVTFLFTFQQAVSLLWCICCWKKLLLLPAVRSVSPYRGHITSNTYSNFKPTLLQRLMGLSLIFSCIWTESFTVRLCKGEPVVLSTGSLVKCYHVNIIVIVCLQRIKMQMFI